MHRRLYDWMVSFAEHPKATLVLFWLSFAESSFFPIPPDVLLLPMALGNRAKAFWYALVTTVGSVLGALLGYAIGVFGIELAIRLIPKVTQEGVDELAAKFTENGDLYVFIAALTPIPFKLVTIVAGSASMNIPIFIGACIVGRGMRFFAGAGLVWLVGPKAKPLIEKYFNLACIVAGVLLAGAYFAYRALSHH
ncbi:MAG: DedA family protein [Phycisphaeraceae bacterium]|nr:DedA family protein [Phycisphaeraceae bacterium]